MNADLNANARNSELETKLADALNRLYKNEGTVEQMNRSIASGNRMTNWQFVVFVLALVGSLLGSMYWATGVLEKRFDERFTQMEKRYEENRQQMEKRFDDLRQDVLSQRKQ
ncbi:MAG: hypothetical protein SF097_08450 [Acidobacteriota bacterium]|nr:hypothetical protein [Acidobacteriota bacterium]